MVVIFFKSRTVQIYKNYIKTFIFQFGFYIKHRSYIVQRN